MIEPTPLPLSELAAFLAVSQESPTGLVWVVSPTTNVKVGTPAGTMTTNGYYRVRLNGQRYPNHRVVWALVNRRDPGLMQIDHRDRNRTNNDPNNLQLTTHRGNHQNRKNQSKCGVGVKAEKWGFEARIKVNRCQIHLGTFKTSEEASDAYYKAVQDLAEAGE